jgi:hypothetical protein
MQNAVRSSSILTDLGAVKFLSAAQKLRDRLEKALEEMDRNEGNYSKHV